MIISLVKFCVLNGHFDYAFVLQEYDFVFDIEVDDASPTMRQLKLPYNKDGESLPWG